MALAVLFVKTSSLGDVVHNMPAASDVRRRYPNARIDWAVEEAYVPLVKLHAGVDRVIPVAIRRWRASLGRRATWGEIGGLRRALGDTRYDAVIDTQGLLKSAIVARMARGTRYGFDRASAREPLAARCYERGFAVPRSLHAIDRCRALAARALDYEVAGPIDYGLRALAAGAGAAAPILLLHGTARPEKAWPEAHWRDLARALAGRGSTCVLLRGTADEEARSLRIAEGIMGVHVLDRMGLDALARTIAGTRAVIGVDTGLAHLAAAIGRPLVAIFGATDPALTGPRGTGPIAVLAAATSSTPAPATPAAVLHALDRLTP